MVLSLLTILIGAPAAGAAVTTIDGDRMTVFIGDTGKLNARIAGSATNSFFPPANPEGNAGITLGFPTTAANPSELHGQAFQFGAFEPVAQGAVTGAGTARNPLTQVTTFRTPGAATTGGLQVVQTVTYVNGRTSFIVRYAVSVVGEAPLNFRLSESADLYVGGSDGGVGELRAGPRTVLGVHPEPDGGTGGIVELTPWSHYFEGQYTDANGIPTSPDQPGYPDTVEPGLVDNGVGVQFDSFTGGPGLAPGAPPATFVLRWAFNPGDGDGDDSDRDGWFDDEDNCPSAANPEQEDADGDGTGDACEIADRDGDGVADGGDNCPDAGNADQRDTDGDRAGDACDPEPRGPDADRDGVLDVADNCPTAANPTQADADADGPGDACDASNGAIPPVVGTTAAARVISGTVLIRTGGTSRPLSGGETVPIGATVDASKGEVAITAATGRAGRTHEGRFAAGIFQIKQQRLRRGQKTVTPIEIVLRGPAFASSCRRRGGSNRRRPSKGVVRQVRGTAKGVWRMRARASTSTVRNASWLTQDRCDGTLTRVQRGRVSVRDKARKRTVTVKAGRSYLAQIFQAKVRRGRG